MTAIASNIPTNPVDLRTARLALRAIKEELNALGVAIDSPVTILLGTAGANSAGDATNPAIASKGDTNTGIYWVSTDSLGMTMGGTLCIRWTNVSETFRSAMVLGWSSSTTAPSTANRDVALSRGAADVLELGSGDSFRPADASAQKLGDSTHTWRVYHDVIATASLPAAAAAMDGVVLIEDAGAGNRNLIVYAGGERFRIDGGANV